MAGAPTPAAPLEETLPVEGFLAVDVRVGTIVEASPFPEARKPAFTLRIDFGAGIGIKTSSAQITALYCPEELTGRQVMAVVNLRPRQIGPFLSEVLVLGFEDENGHVVLAGPDRRVPDGTRMT